MTDSEYIILRLEDIRFRDADGEWWRKDSGHLAQVFECVTAAGLNPGYRYYGRSGEDELPAFRELEEVLQASLTWDRGSYVLSMDPDDHESATKLHMTFDPGAREEEVLGALTLRLEIRDPLLETVRGTVLDQCIDFTVRLHKALQDRAFLGPNLAVDLLNLPFPRTRPPRYFGRTWRPGNAVHIVSPEYHRNSSLSPRWPEDMEKMLQAPPPEGVTRTERDGLTIFRWLEDLTDPDKSAERMALQESWLIDVLDPKIKPGYNELGDKHMAPQVIQPQPHPLLTAYDGFFDGGVGYKATVINPDGTVDEALFEEMASWINARELPDGTPLGWLRLILPNRESALQLQERAAAMGIDRVYYADDEGQWWDPAPPGLWRE